MSEPVIVAFCARNDRERICSATLAVSRLMPPLVWAETAYVPERRLGEPLILLAMGHDGGAALAAWVAEHGLDGARGIGLVGVTAPWGERPSPWLCFQCEYSQNTKGCGCEVGAMTAHECGAEAYLPLGPLEPLRVAAERARVPARCENWSQEEFAAQTNEHGTCSEVATFLRITPPGEARSGPDKPFCSKHARRWKARFLAPIEPIRFIVACAPDDGVCATCMGGGVAFDLIGRKGPCKWCSGSGKALSSADVAKEMCGFEFDWPAMANWRTRTVGGVSVVSFLTAKHLADDGLRAVVERITR